MNLNQYKTFVKKKLTEKRYIQKEIEALNDKRRKEKIIHLRLSRALVFINDIALKTQQQVEFHIEKMVSSGLNYVFDDQYGFKVNFKLRRGKTECDLFIEKDDYLIDPVNFSGLGEADICGFNLRVVSLNMLKSLRPVLILDEPFKHLKGEKENKRIIDLMQTLSHELNIQIIMVNDERASREDIIAGSDKVFYVKQKKGVSQITELSKGENFENN